MQSLFVNLIQSTRNLFRHLNISTLPSIQSIENPSRPEPTVQNLLGELDALKRIRDQMVKRGDQQISTWLENVKDSEVQIDEIKKDLDERNRDLHLNDLSRRVKLKAELIESVKVVKVLKERAVEMFLHGITGDMKRFSYDDLISFTSNFSKEIGFGAFGIVYRGRFPKDVQVALKVLVQNCLIEETFMIEVGTMLKASHPNLIKLYGFCFDGNMKALVYEFMEKGSLDVVLLQNPCPVEWQTLYGIALEIAMVLAYLHHDCDDRIIHHDIKPSNILLDSKLSPKVTDFGTARILNSDVSHFTMTNMRGTCGYTAPEMIMHSSRVTTKCDVYSYGKLLFDILGIKSNTPEQVWGKFVKGELDETIKECGVMEKDIKRARILCLVAFWCIQFSEEIRPSMKEVVNALEMKMQVAKPPNPFLSWTGNFLMQQSEDSPSAYEREEEIPSSSMVGTYSLSSSSSLNIQKGDITQWSIDGVSDAIVNPTNERMLASGGVDEAIHKAAGPELWAACYNVKMVLPRGVRCPTGEARITPAFKLPVSRVIHTVGPVPGLHSVGLTYYVSDYTEILLRSAYRSCLELAKKNNIQHIAFPAISCGLHGYPYDEAATIAISTVKEFGGYFKEIHFVLFADDIYSIWLKEANRLLRESPMDV